MQATGTFQEARSSKGFILVVLAMLCALLLGAAGGYAARSAGSAAGAPAVHGPLGVHGNLGYYSGSWPLNANQGGPDSDRTRALPTSAPADPAAGYDISQWTEPSAAPAGHSAPDHGVIP